MKKCFLVMAVLLPLFFSCVKDGVPIIGVFTFEPMVTYEYNAAILRFELKYPGTVKVLTLHYSMNSDLKDAISVNMEYDSQGRCYKTRLSGLIDKKAYYYQLEVNDGIGSFRTETYSFLMNNTHNVPYYQSFADGVGSYYYKSLKGTQTWTFKNGYASMSGKDNIDILCSSPINLTTVKDAKLLMKYKASGENTIMKIKALEGYSDGDDYWHFSAIQEMSLEETDQWKMTVMPLDNCVGKTITFVVHYQSSKDVAGKLDIQEIMIE